MKKRDRKFLGWILTMGLAASMFGLVGCGGGGAGSGEGGGEGEGASTGKKRIMVFVGIKEVANAQERFRGTQEALEGTNIEIVDLMTDDVDFAKARKNAENTLTTHPDIQALVGLWEYNPPQLLNALEGAGKLGKIQVIGFDENFATLRAIDEGTCQGTVCQNPYVFGYDSMGILRDIIVDGKDEAEVVAAAKAKHGGPEDDPKLIYVDTRVIRKGEGLAYLAECQARLESVKGLEDAPAGDDKTKLAFVTNASADFWSYSHAGVKQFEKDHPDVQVIFKAGDGTPAKQKQIVDDLISSGVKGIAISPIDPVAQTKMINEWAEKIKVICCDSDAPQANRVCYFGTDNVEGGRRVGMLVKEALGE